MVALFAEAITTAHESNPNGWSLVADKLTGGKQFLRLTCNEMIVLGLTKQQLQVAAKLTADATGTPETFGLEATVSPDTQYDEVIHYRIPAAAAAKLPRDVVIANAEAIDWLGGKGWTNSAHHYIHQDDWRARLSQLTGTALPAPGYLPSSKYGLSPYLGDTDNPKSLHEMLSNRFAAVGLTYTPTQIASFYTALQTKGFVILSGISGTGKSKIAQQFADMLPMAQGTQQGRLREDSTLIRLRLWPYMAKYNRSVIPKKYASPLQKPAPGDSVDVTVLVDGVAGEGRAVVSTPSGNALTEIHPKGEAAGRFDELEVEYFFVDFDLKDDDTTGPSTSGLPLLRRKL